MSLFSGEKQQVKKEIVSIQYDGRDLLICIPLIIIFPIILAEISDNDFFLLAIFLYTILLYVYYLIKKSFRITISDTLIVWETLWRKKIIHLNEITFLGIGWDPMEGSAANYICPQDKLIYLLAGDYHISFNPRCFYDKNSFFSYIADEKEQLSWKENESEIISYLKEKCTYPIDDKRKKRLLFKLYIMNHVKMIYLTIIGVSPLFPAACYDYYINH